MIGSRFDAGVTGVKRRIAGGFQVIAFLDAIQPKLSGDCFAGFHPAIYVDLHFPTRWARNEGRFAWSIEFGVLRSLLGSVSHVIFFWFKLVKSPFCLGYEEETCLGDGKILKLSELSVKYLGIRTYD